MICREMFRFFDGIAFCFVPAQEILLQKVISDAYNKTTCIRKEQKRWNMMCIIGKMASCRARRLFLPRRLWWSSWFYSGEVEYKDEFCVWWSANIDGAWTAGSDIYSRLKRFAAVSHPPRHHSGGAGTAWQQRWTHLSPPAGGKGIPKGRVPLALPRVRGRSPRRREKEYIFAREYMR